MKQSIQNSLNNKIFQLKYGNSVIPFTIAPNKNCQDLLEHVRGVMKRKYPDLDSNQIIALKTIDDNDVLDSYLLMKNQLVERIEQNQTFELVIRPSDLPQRSKMHINDLDFIKCIGKGGSSEVYLVRHKNNGKMYALKQIIKQTMEDQRRFEQIILEQELLKELSHIFLVQLRATFESENHLNFLIDFYPGGELFFHLQKLRFDEDDAKFFFCEIVQVLEYLHNKQILYRDLKPENILLGVDGHIKLTDFGLCKTGLGPDELTHSFCGSPEYMAPEVVTRQGHSYGVDFYTLGALLHELVLGLPPFYSRDPDEMMANILQDQLELPQEISDELYDLLMRLCDKNMHERLIDFEVIKGHPWLNGINWDDVQNKKLKSPININLLETNIHDEFLEIPIEHEKFVESEDFQGIVDLFNYVVPESEKELLNYQYEETTAQQTDAQEKLLQQKQQMEWQQQQQQKQQQQQQFQLQEDEQIHEQNLQMQQQMQIEQQLQLQQEEQEKMQRLQEQQIRQEQEKQLQDQLKQQKQQEELQRQQEQQQKEQEMLQQIQAQKQKEQQLKQQQLIQQQEQQQQKEIEQVSYHEQEQKYQQNMQLQQQKQFQNQNQNLNNNTVTNKMQQQQQLQQQDVKKPQQHSQISQKINQHKTQSSLLQKQLLEEKINQVRQQQLQYQEQKPQRKSSNSLTQPKNKNPVTMQQTPNNTSKMNLINKQSSQSKGVLQKGTPSKKQQVSHSVDKKGQHQFQSSQKGGFGAIGKGLNHATSMQSQIGKGGFMSTKNQPGLKGFSAKENTIQHYQQQNKENRLKGNQHPETENSTDAYYQGSSNINNNRPGTNQSSKRPSTAQDKNKKKTTGNSSSMIKSTVKTGQQQQQRPQSGNKKKQQNIPNTQSYKQFQHNHQTPQSAYIPNQFISPKEAFIPRQQSIQLMKNSTIKSGNTNKKQGDLCVSNYLSPNKFALNSQNSATTKHFAQGNLQQQKENILGQNFQNPSQKSARSNSKKGGNAQNTSKNQQAQNQSYTSSSQIYQNQRQPQQYQSSMNNKKLNQQMQQLQMQKQLQQQQQQQKVLGEKKQSTNNNNPYQSSAQKNINNYSKSSGNTVAMGMNISNKNLQQSQQIKANFSTSGMSHNMNMNMNGQVHKQSTQHGVKKMTGYQSSTTKLGQGGPSQKKLSVNVDPAQHKKIQNHVTQDKRFSLAGNSSTLNKANKNIIYDQYVNAGTSKNYARQNFGF